jgi:hypothetical protein
MARYVSGTEDIRYHATINANIFFKNYKPSTYGHSQLKTGHPVRSAIHKQLNGRLVLRWVTTWESLLLYVLFCRRPQSFWWCSSGTLTASHTAHNCWDVLTNQAARHAQSHTLYYDIILSLPVFHTKRIVRTRLFSSLRYRSGSGRVILIQQVRSYTVEGLSDNLYEAGDLAEQILCEPRQGPVVHYGSSKYPVRHVWL